MVSKMLMTINDNDDDNIDDNNYTFFNHIVALKGISGNVGLFWD